MIVLLGRSSSGKDTIAGRLIKRGMHGIVSYTSRPMRPGETDGVEYHFITNEEFDKKIEDGHFFAEHSHFKFYDGRIIQYGSALEDLTDDALLIADLSRYNQLILHNNIHCMGVLLLCPREIAEERMISRGDNINEVKRRLDADDIDFANANDTIYFAIRNDGSLDIDSIVDLIITAHSKFIKACKEREL